MRYIINPNQYKLIIEQKYNEEEIMNIASKYSTPTEFRKKDQYIARQAFKNKELWDRVTKHMKKRPQVKRTEEDLYAEALKYDNLKDFYTKSASAYMKARKLGILDKITKHMKILSGLSKRVVYAFEFPDNSVYIGLTHDVSKREKQHQIEGSVSKHIKETNLLPELILISDDYIDANDAQKMEACTIESYRSNGWKILNRAKAGSLGTCRVFWTKERVKELTKKLSTWKEFSEHKGAFDSAYRNGWIDDQEITGHLLKVRKEYDEESIWNIIKQINSYGEFRVYDNNRLYQAAKARNMLDNIAEYYGYKMKKKYDEDTIWNMVKEFDSYSEFRNYDNKKLYGAARERRLLDDIKKYFDQNINDQTMQ
jgi:predicted GIY-YIG superfamily endonuclease